MVEVLEVLLNNARVQRPNVMPITRGRVSLIDDHWFTLVNQWSLVDSCAAQRVPRCLDQAKLLGHVLPRNESDVDIRSCLQRRVDRLHCLPRREHCRWGIICRRHRGRIGRSDYNHNGW
jgi:hypothetical protein